MKSMSNISYEAYRRYVLMDGSDDLEIERQTSRTDLLGSMIDNPDYHPDSKRNGVVQPLLLTRGGEQHSYNVICRPGDELFAGDIIDAFGHKWIVMEARADITTHKTGVMYQCNQLFRFQNFDATILEAWAYISQSGYSSQVTGTNQIQKAEEQFAIYMPYNEDTQKLYVDKRLGSHIGYDQFGHKILVSFKITSASPNTKSYNHGDHLLLIKAIRDVFSETTDNLDELICDYISPDVVQEPQETNLLRCKISGGTKLMLGRTRTYNVSFFAQDGESIVDGINAHWEYPEIDGISYVVDDSTLKISVANHDDLIGEEIVIRASDMDGAYAPAEICLEVGNIA